MARAVQPQRTPELIGSTSVTSHAESSRANEALILPAARSRDSGTPTTTRVAPTTTSTIGTRKRPRQPTTSERGPARTMPMPAADREDRRGRPDGRRHALGGQGVTQDAVGEGGDRAAEPLVHAGADEDADGGGRAPQRCSRG